ncbi:hypothetical protein [Hyphomicrobium denitrificans]|uniref:hypothetical protein n=1 Tax=Hyphomicrobium denitrificans TaxID=53399 RepID=UPI001181B329|nr:hypothetical protein [Hyphomicrobium denitrificans]
MSDHASCLHDGVQEVADLHTFIDKNETLWSLWRRRRSLPRQVPYLLLPQDTQARPRRTPASVFQRPRFRVLNPSEKLENPSLSGARATYRANSVYFCMFSVFFGGETWKIKPETRSLQNCQHSHNFKK